MPHDYMLKLTLRFLGESGLAEIILNSKDECKIPYRKIPIAVSSSKHQSFGDIKSPNYYRFVSEYLHAVISLCGECPANTIKMTSKYMSMDKGAVEKFRKGWQMLNGKTLSGVDAVKL